ncbi:hypothetical protein [Flagellimonas profundi]|uniref:DUF5723 domain-containing protein n=1 Tax=Flagellimonas profundi TaxID=2915620 RepID=A0ABS3FD83_9FLAO|nr:hypothetical protein [Allomuricauda profundi]MBO0340897.1 hypothetical protein [Allomuricauda profundi]
MRLLEYFVHFRLTLVFSVFSIFTFLTGFGQNTQAHDSLYPARIYDFSIINGRNLFTIRQINTNYVSTNRILARLINKKTSKVDRFLQFGISFLGIAVTHEEGHRSILTDLEIGSVSQPFSIFKGVAYVKGVTDETLIDLRNNNLDDYVRLHTAGLESDYAILTRTETLLAFGEDNFENLGIDYLTRKASLIGYYLTNLIPGLFSKMEEEENELERDIVGHDLFGAIKNLHRPSIEFYRYTNFDDLTKDERKFARTVGWLSILNLINPMLLGKNNFKVSQNLKVNAGLGYTMAPFGGFLDENFWFNFKNKYRIHFYLRQFHNKDNLFFGTGIKLFNHSLFTDKIILNSELHFWNQPENLDFFTSISKSGVGGVLNVGYSILNSLENTSNLYLNLGLSQKTQGFLPEYASLDNRTMLNLGFSLVW